MYFNLLYRKASYQFEYLLDNYNSNLMNTIFITQCRIKLVKMDIYSV